MVLNKDPKWTTKETPLDIDLIPDVYFETIESVTAFLNRFRDLGFVINIGSGVAQVVGLYNAQAGEMVKLGQLKITGLVVNLEVNCVLVIIFGNDRHLSDGNWVSRTGALMSIPVDRTLLNAVIDPLGNFLELFEDLWRYEAAINNPAETQPIDTKALGIIKRQPVCEPLQTGIQLVDSLIPIGCGQRELIIGDRQTGKTTIAIDAIINQTLYNTGVIWFYVAIGQKKANVVQIIKKLRNLGALKRGAVILTAADEPAALQYLAPYSGCTLGEWFCTRGSAKVLVIYDDLSKQAVAYRQMSLLLRRPPGREAFPGDVFYLHARLLERACKLSDACGGGSLTALPIIETQAGDVSAFIPTNVISITDGQIYLDPEMFNKGIQPAINVGISVSRVGSKAQVTTMKALAGRLRVSLAEFKEIEMIIKFGSALDKATLAIMERGLRLTELLKQPHSAPLSVREQVLFIFSGVYGWLDLIKYTEVADYKIWLLNYIKTTNLFYEFDVDAELNVDNFNSICESCINTYKS
jgi:proton translocating ATP synthase F1 alpha subunit